jgi:hypothetical protein
MHFYTHAHPKLGFEYHLPILRQQPTQPATDAVISTSFSSGLMVQVEYTNMPYRTHGESCHKFDDEDGTTPAFCDICFVCEQNMCAGICRNLRHFTQERCGVFADVRCAALV